MRKSGDSTSREKMGNSELLITSCLERNAYHLCIDMFIIYILIYICLFNRCIAYNHCAGAKITCLLLFSVQMNMISLFGDVHDMRFISNYTATLRRKTGFSRNSSLTLTGLDISLGLTCCFGKMFFATTLRPGEFIQKLYSVCHLASVVSYCSCSRMYLTLYMVYTSTFILFS